MKLFLKNIFYTESCTPWPIDGSIPSPKFPESDFLMSDFLIDDISVYPDVLTAINLLLGKGCETVTPVARQVVQL